MLHRLGIEADRFGSSIGPLTGARSVTRCAGAARPLRQDQVGPRTVAVGTSGVAYRIEMRKNAARSLASAGVRCGPSSFVFNDPRSLE